MPPNDPAPRAESLDWSSAPPAAQRRALFDLGRRADRGIWIHPALWVLLALAGNCHRVAPAFFWITSACFVGVSIWRFVLARRREAMAEQDLKRPTRQLAAALIACALCWGVTAVITLATPSLAATMRTLLLIVMGALSASGTMVLAIHPAVRRWYAWAVVAPSQVWILLNPDMQGLFVLAASLFMVLYIVKASRAVYDDYWSAAQARLTIERHAAQLERLSAFDALTQVHNRFTFDHRLESLWAQAGQRREPLALLLIDIDHFKRLNDTYGHVAGDHALRRTADALRGCMQRPGDVLARYGGEEFAVLLPDTDLGDALQFADRLRAATAAQALDGPLAGVRVTCSIGVHVMVPRADQDMLELVRGADAALYAAKGAGRDRVHARPLGLVRYG